MLGSEETLCDWGHCCSADPPHSQVNLLNSAFPANGSKAKPCKLFWDPKMFQKLTLPCTGMEWQLRGAEGAIGPLLDWQALQTTQHQSECQPFLVLIGPGCYAHHSD